ncbi:membrane lipoprotein lipid attachment site-containing protein [Shouchella patagoniensis]|uniref:membrane lipoprotein lipid attachment site-containing protein n=1 Tax=Shouchella patagoniensis TaxID=228576 RepID=UPI00099491EE|nr:membrane lipoprotein lipid attachment site-containing protein [Shouchella patagoniensis]
MKKMVVLLGTIVLLTACSEASDDTSVISPKELNESEKRYLDIGTEYAYVYETSDFPDDLSTLNLDLHAYQGGEKSEERSRQLFGLKAEEGESLFPNEAEELVISLSAFEVNEEESESVSYYYDVSVLLGSEDGYTEYNGSVDVPKIESLASLADGDLRLENTSQNIFIYFEGSEVSSGVSSDQESLNHLINESELVYVFTLTWE